MKKGSIRNAGFEDVPSIYSLIKEHQDKLLPRSVSDIVQNIDRFIVCVERRKVVGIASWEILPEPGRMLDPSIELKSIAVRDDYKGRGIGAAMVTELLKRVSVFHPAKIVVLTFTPDFFRKFGFRKTPKKNLMHKLYTGCMNCTKYDSPFTCPEVAMVLEIKGKRARECRRSG